MKIQIKKIFPAFLIFTFIIIVPLYAQNIPLGDKVYDLIDRAATMDLLSAQPLTHRPFDRITIAKLLVEIENNNRDELFLSPALKNELHRQIYFYKQEIACLVNDDWWNSVTIFQPEIPRLIHKIGFKTLPEYLENNNGQVFSFQYNKETWLNINPVYVFKVDKRQESDVVYRRAWGVSLEASPANWIKASVRWQDFMEWGNDKYGSWGDRTGLIDDRIGFVNPTEKTSIAYEDLLAGIHLYKNPVEVFFGKDRVSWGPGRKGNLLLSGESAPFTHFRLTFNLGSRIRFSGLTGRLSPWPEVNNITYEAPTGHIRKIIAEKYISAHRMEIAFSPRFRLGIQEAVIYAERGIDLNYLNPFTVYFSEEHDSGDQDNALMAMDLWFSPKKGWSLWSEFLLDDFQFGKLGTDFSGNKAAILLGSAVNLQKKFMPSEIGAEYIAIRPYVYSHFYPINTYKQWNAPLGAQLQPNSDRLSIWTAWWLNSGLRFGVESYILRHSENLMENDSLLANYGGDYDYGWPKNSSYDVPFLEHNVKHTFLLQSWIEWECIEGLLLNIRAGVENDTDKDKEIFILSSGLSWNYPEFRRWTLRGR